MIHWQNIEGHQFRIRNKLLPYKRAPGSSFCTSAFESLWNTVPTRLASGIFQLSFWHPRLLLQVHVDASAADFGVLSSGDDPVTNQASLFAMFSNNNTKNYRHSSVAQVDGLIACLQAFSSFLSSRDSQLFTENAALLSALRVGSANPYILHRLDLLLTYFPQLCFVAGSDNRFADFLTGFTNVLYSYTSIEAYHSPQVEGELVEVHRQPRLYII